MKSADENKNWLCEQAWTLVICEGRYLALPSAAIEISVAAPRIHPLPFAPDHIRGIAHLNGDVMPCLDLARLVGGQGGADSQEALVIACQGRKAIVLVDQAIRQIVLSDEDRERVSVLETVESDDSAVLAEWTLDGRSVFMLDPACLTRFSAQQKTRDGRPGIVAEHDTYNTETAEEDQLDNLFLYVRVGEQFFALPVMGCSEIVELGNLARVPGSSAAIAGLMLLRGVSYLTIDASVLLGIDQQEASAAVVVRTGSHQVLLSVATIESVRAVPRHQIRKVGDKDALLGAVIEVPDEPIRAVITLEQLPVSVPDLAQFAPAMQADQGAMEHIETQRFLLVRWGKEVFALDLSGVDCLAPMTRLKPLRSDQFAGMINVDGDVIPVIAGECFYGCEGGAEGCEGFVILEHQHLRFAVMLEQAEGIVDVDKRHVQGSRGSDDQRFSATVRYQDQLVSQMSLEHFFSLVNENLESPE